MRNRIIIDKDLNLLRQKVIHKSGIKLITKLDCALLSELILKSGSGYISETTIYRLFLKENNKHIPYKSTLDILCKYIGLISLSNFIQHSFSSNKLADNKDSLNNSLSILLYACINHKSYKALCEYFDRIDEESETIKKYAFLNLFDALSSTKNNVNFFKKFSENKFVREWVLELGHDPKFRIANYEDAYLLYLAKVKKIKDVSDFQQFIFGNSVLFKSYYLKQDYFNASIIGKRLYAMDVNIFLSNNSYIHFFPYVRYISYRLWYMILINSPISQIFDYANYLIEFTKDNLNTADQLKCNILFNTIGEVIVCSNLPSIYHIKFKSIFFKELSTLNLVDSEIKLGDLVNHFQPNGLLHYRP